MTSVPPVNIMVIGFFVLNSIMDLIISALIKGISHERIKFSSVLEFSKPVVPGLDKIYDFYSFKILPKMGKVIANDEESYQYLSESIRMHPDQETLKDMMSDAGFDRCDYTNMSGGIVALHRGYKF